MKRLTPPYLSVVIATRNRQALLPNAVESILDQSFTEFELIVVDDASTDATPTVLTNLEKQDPRVRTVRLDTNCGPGTARNIAMQQAVGRWVAVMDDDDLANPDRLEVQVELLERHPEVDLVFSTVTWVDGVGRVLRVFPDVVVQDAFPCVPKDVFTLLYLESNKIPNTTIMFRRSLLRIFDGYPSTPWIGEDWYWFMQMAASGVGMHANTRPLVRQLRDQAYPNLMRNHREVFSAQRQVLKKIRTWLDAQRFLFPASLHQLAFSNQLVREARASNGVRGLLLCQQALLLVPTSRYAWSTVREIVTRGRQKIRRPPALYQDE